MQPNIKDNERATVLFMNSPLPWILLGRLHKKLLPGSVWDVDLHSAKDEPWPPWDALLRSVRQCVARHVSRWQNPIHCFGSSTAFSPRSFFFQVSVQWVSMAFSVQPGLFWPMVHSALGFVLGLCLLLAKASPELHCEPQFFPLSPPFRWGFPLVSDLHLVWDSL